MTVVLWMIVSNYLINSILEREWKTTAQWVRADVMNYLVADDFRTEDRTSTAQKFELVRRHLTLLPDIIRFKVYNPQGVVIWSDDKRLVGQSFADNQELQKAVGGKVVADISFLDKKENVFEHGSYERAVEVYVPVYAADGEELLGVVETYKRADSIYEDIRKARILVLLGAVGGGLLLYISLFAIVRQAARKIDEQQQNLLKMHTELVASQRMAAVGEVTAAVAHGIGNPLSSIRAAAQVAKLDGAAHVGCQEWETTQRAFQNIIEQVDRVQRRMQGLLNFARPLEPCHGPVEVNMLLRDVAETLRSRFEKAQVALHLDLAQNLPQPMLDPNHMEQVFMGLMTNALEATPSGGHVMIRTRVGNNGGGRAVCVSIEDSGEGIPVENRKRVFEPFFTTKPHGTGIGLPIAKKLLERNGGAIAIADGSKGGARVDVTLSISNSK